MTKHIHIVAKTEGGDVDFSLIPLTESLAQTVMGHYAILTAHPKMVQVEFWEGAPVFFGAPNGDHPADVTDILTQATEKGYALAPGRPDLHGNLFRKVGWSTMAVEKEAVHWKAGRGGLLISTSKVPISVLASRLNPYLKPGTKAASYLDDGTPLYPAHHRLRHGERFQRSMGTWSGQIGEWRRVTLGGRLFEQMQCWGGQGPSPSRWQEFTVGHQVGRPVDRYLVQFRDHGKDYLKTDCAFRDGQLDLAKTYVRTIVDTLDRVLEGQVLDATNHMCVYKYP